MSTTLFNSKFHFIGDVCACGSRICYRNGRMCVGCQAARRKRSDGRKAHVRKFAAWAAARKEAAQ